MRGNANDFNAYLELCRRQSVPGTPASRRRVPHLVVRFIAAETAVLRGLLRLRKEHEDAPATQSFNGESFFLRALRNGEAVAMFVVDGFAIGKKHVVMRAVARNLRKRDLPAAARVARHRQFLPAGKSAGDFNDGRSFRRAVGQLPSKNFAISRFTFVRPMRRGM